ncbi:MULTISPECIES: hypothetical protein [Klebsiella]|uniref:hypothetical protein n=1 Tax=Klebsiella TaxID=570 RepID=UPI00063C0EAD|nr:MULTISPECIES: hypothetical protein [Enterobacteriaceae]EKL1154884.1 hypothetical protein [Klebsiella pneumoniae]KLF44793.1 hypothetical protein YA33_09735 [Klebsiella aerogenes]MEA4538319.1 hypothetical protein [Klebsiella pneumoniae]RWV34242.1 hypothetical protein EPU31_04220 [Escherichia coli]RWV47730.1 hypothetical protein EPU08_04210 [Escherichia coli]
MTTKKELSNQIDPELQIFIDKIAAKYQPNPEVLQRRIENAEARYNKFQNFADIPARLVDRLQALILDGWRFHLSGPASVLANSSMISVTLQKPAPLIETELKELRSKASDSYTNELFSGMEREIDELMQQAAEDSQRKAEKQAEAEQAAMRDRLRSLLSGGAKA